MAQTYQCDICGTVAGDFMVTYIADGRVVSVGVECLPIWALPIAAGWAEALIDQGAEVPEWAPVVIDAYRQLIALEADPADGPSEPPEAGSEPDTAPGPDSGSPGRTEAGEPGSETVGEDTEAAPATAEHG